jgi:Ca-activated chloride channel family protein
MVYFSFIHPEYLWYLLSVPLLIVTHFALLRYIKHKALRFANFVAMKRVSEGKIIVRNSTILALRVLTVFLLIMAIAGTTYWYKGLSSESDLVIAIDTSSSMTAKDFSPSRLDAAKDFSKKAVQEFKGESNIGIVTFSGVAVIEQLPSKDKSKVLNTIDLVDYSQVGGTDIPGAIITATNLLIPAEKGKNIILITDGSNTVGGTVRDPITAGVKYAKDNGVIIYTIGIGSDIGPLGYLPEYYNISAVYDENTLLRIANETSGKYYYAGTNAELDKQIQELMSNTEEAYLHIDLTLGLLIISLLLIFIEWGLINTRFRSIP